MAMILIPDRDADLAPAQSGQANQSDRDPDSALMRKSARHEYRQAYNAQAIVDADGSALILATNVLSTTNDRQDLDGSGGTALRYRWQALHALG